MTDDEATLLGLGAVGLAVSGFLWWSHRRHAGTAAADSTAAASEVYEADDVEALARVITSEAGSHRYTDEERRRIAWVVRNRANHRHVTIAHLVCTPCGPQGKARPFASSQPATPGSRQLAREVLAAPASGDPTSGALAFFEPRMQDQLVASGRPGYRFTSAALREKWQREGQRPTGAVGAFEFWA